MKDLMLIVKDLAQTQKTGLADKREQAEMMKTHNRFMHEQAALLVAISASEICHPIALSRPSIPHARTRQPDQLASPDTRATLAATVVSQDLSKPAGTIT